MYFFEHAHECLLSIHGFFFVNSNYSQLPSPCPVRQLRSEPDIPTEPPETGDQAVVLCAPEDLLQKSLRVIHLGVKDQAGQRQTMPSPMFPGSHVIGNLFLHIFALYIYIYIYIYIYLLMLTNKQMHVEFKYIIAIYGLFSQE